MISCFVKFFEEETYADAFVAGSLYLNTLEYFKKLESHAEDGRADPTEALWAWLQPHDVIIKLNVPGYGNVQISQKDLAGPISFADSYHDAVNALCLHTVPADASRNVNGERLELDTDRRCVGLGKFAVVIHHPPNFLDRVRTTLSAQGYRFRYDFVEYYDERTFHGTISHQDVPFRKQQRFSYQREFRLCIYPRVRTNGPLTIDIGDLSSTCTRMSVPQDLSVA